MDCLEAQEIISSALDREDVTDGVLSDAKDHCRTCAECARLVRTLVAIRKAPLPEPPAGLEERVVAAVRREAESHVTSPAPATHPTLLPSLTAEGLTPVVSGTEPATSFAELGTRLWDKRNRRSVVTWSAVAATVFIAAGIGALAGLRTIVTPAPTSMVVLESTGQVTGGTPEEALSAEGAARSASADSMAAKVAGADLIEVGGVAYRYAGPDASVQPSSLTEVGRTRSDLGQTFVADHRVLGTTDPSRVFISQGSEVLAFDRITRSYQGRTYVLRTRAIGKFGESPTLPQDIPEPSSGDGSPTFTAESGTEDGAYVLTGRDASAGIALAPGADPSLSSGWTWWTPAP